MTPADKVRAALASHAMLEGADTVICALSGGADSVCMTHILLGLREELGIQIVAAHFDHGLRGEASAEDARFSAALCEAWGVPLLTECGDTAAYSAAQHLGIEAAARELRYGFFRRCEAQYPGSRVATAHQAEDNAETLLLHLVRGAGLRGLGGIPPVRGCFIRPLLGVTRPEVEAYLRENGLPHREDLSNRDPGYSRNRLRLLVMPVLRELNPAFPAAAGRTAALLREDEAFLSALAAPLWNREGDAAFVRIAGQPRPLASRAIRQAADSLGCIPEEKHVSAMLQPAAGTAALELGGGMRASLHQGVWTLRRSPRTQTDPEPIPETELPFGAWTEPEGLPLRIYVGPEAAAGKIHGKFTTYRFKTAEICGRITVRSRRAGDYFHPAGRQCGKKLTKWMIEQKLPAEQRGRIPVLADGTGVLAVGALCADRRLCVPAAEADAAIILTERTEEHGSVLV